MDAHLLLDEIQAVIIPAAREELLPRFARVKALRKQDGSLVTEADTAMQARLARQLETLSSEIALLSEEMSAEEQSTLLASGKPVWCLDPLDGTSNFVRGIPYYCVSLALLMSGRVELALVYDPVRAEIFSACPGRGAWLDGRPLRLAGTGLELDHAIALIDFKRLDAKLATRLVTAGPYRSQRSFGSVALDWCWLAAGRCHIYLHGRSNIWDYAAGSLIFEEAGGYSVGLDGRPVFSYALESRSSVAAVDCELFGAWAAWLGVDLLKGESLRAG